MKSLTSSLFLALYLFFIEDTSWMVVIKNVGTIIALIGAILAVFNQFYTTKSKVIENHEGSYWKWFKSFFKKYRKTRVK